MKTKLAICIGSLLPAGAETLVVQMIKGFDLNKYDIYLFVLEKKYNTHLEEEVENLNVKVSYLNKEEGFSIRTILGLFKMLYRFNPDIIHGHLGGVIYASLYCLVFKTKMVHTVHTLAFEEFKGLKRHYLKILYSWRRIIPVGVSSNISRSIKEVYKLRGEIYTVVNGTDVKKFVSNRKYLDDVVIGHVGRFEKVKNHSVIVEAFKIINQRYPKTKLILVGDGKEKNSIERLINSYQLKEKIDLVGRVNNVSDQLKKIDIFLMPSLYEGLPISIIEAMASGCVIVASNVGGIGEIVINNHNGFLINDPLDIEGFVKKIETLIIDKKIRIQMSRQNQIDVMKFTIEEMIIKYEYIYQTAMNR